MSCERMCHRVSCHVMSCHVRGGCVTCEQVQQEPVHEAGAVQGLELGEEIVQERVLGRALARRERVLWVLAGCWQGIE